MFTIKLVSYPDLRSSNDFAIFGDMKQYFQCDSFKILSENGKNTKIEFINSSPNSVGLTTTVNIKDTAYIINSAGKTIDTILNKNDDLDFCSKPI